MHTLTMFERLKFLTKKSFAPISGFLVSSVVIDEDGNEYEGVNVEYQVPTNSLCAERNAITTAITKGFKFGNLREVHVYAYNTHTNNERDDYAVSPCGACRQAIVEASLGNCKVFMYAENGTVVESTIRELLPLSFEGVEKQ